MKIKHLKKYQAYKLLFAKLKNFFSFKKLFTNRVRPRFRIPRHYKVSYLRNQTVSPITDFFKRKDPLKVPRDKKSFAKSYLEKKYSLFKNDPKILNKTSLNELKESLVLRKKLYNRLVYETNKILPSSSFTY